MLQVGSHQTLGYMQLDAKKESDDCNRQSLEGRLCV